MSEAIKAAAERLRGIEGPTFHGVDGKRHINEREYTDAVTLAMAWLAEHPAGESGRYPIQDGPSVPWAYMMPHESQAKRNHGQTLTRLAERGGLGAAEAELIVTAQPLSPKTGEWDWAELKRRWIERAERVNNAYLATVPLDGTPMQAMRRS